uniref:RHS repeat domain-containing protein n=1 Tax=Chitinivorax sp. B TaxID=2502235 RepID=UPI0024B5976E
DPSKPLIYHVYADHLNTPRAIYDAFNKRLTWRWESEAFGNTLPDQDADKNGSQFVYHLRFPGQYWDNGIKLSHNWYRTYNPETGRYVQSDPIGLQGGLNTYGYVGGNPLIFFDPLGWAFNTGGRGVGRGGRFGQDWKFGDGDPKSLDAAKNFVNPNFTKLKEIPWSSKMVKNAAKDIENGATEVCVGSKAEAAELFLGKFHGQGYKNTSGFRPTQAKDFFGGKEGTYHWDIGKDAYPHGQSHLQVHTHGGDVVRIYFPD